VKTEKAKRTRSPAYPAIGLEEAVQNAAIVWQKANRHPVSADSIGKFWGYDAKSSTGYSMASALKKFGLLIEKGSKEKRELQLSDAAIKLVYDPDRSSVEYSKALKASALTPAIHRELWNKYAPDLPDDGIIKRFLVVDRKFNQKYVDACITNFRNTIAFANLQRGDTVEQSDYVPPNKDAPKREIESTMMPPSPEPGQLRSQTPPPLVRQSDPLMGSDLSLPLESGRTLQIPTMTEDDYELMMETLKLWKRRIVKA
jgi:hypothetical protein